MAEKEILWQGLTLGGVSSYVVTDLTGWDELPGVTDLSVARVRGHGDHMGDLYGQGRTVTLTGEIRDDGTDIGRDALFQQLMAVTPISSATSPLNITLFGQSLTADARVIRRALNPGALFGQGVIPFALQWRCPDPLRYGPTRTAVTGLASTSGGLVYPLVYPLTYGTTVSSGQLLLANEGTADAPVVFSVTGWLPDGFVLSSGGLQIVYAAEVPAGQTVTIDTGDGSVEIAGGGDRRGNVAFADWMQVPAGSSIAVTFSSLGGAYDPNATARATYQPASW